MSFIISLLDSAVFQPNFEESFKFSPNNAA